MGEAAAPGPGIARAEPQPRDDAADSAPAVTRSTPFRIGFGAVSLIAIIAALWAAKALLMPVVFAILLTLLLTPVVSFFDGLGMPRWLGAAIVVSVSLALLALAALQLSSPAQRWLNPRSPEWSRLEAQWRELKGPLARIRGAQERIAEMAEPTEGARPREVVVQRRDFLDTLGEFPSIALGGVSTVVLVFFLLASDDIFLRKLIRVLPTLEDKKMAVGIARTIQLEIGRYFATIAMSNFGLAAATAAWMAVIGMPSPIFWGAVVGLLNFVPYLGAAVSLVLLTAAAVASLDGWAIAAVPLGFLVLTTIEGQFVQPILVGRRMQLNVVVTFLAVMFGGWLWGLGGLFIAVPMLVVLKICADHIEQLSAIGEFIAHE